MAAGVRDSGGIGMLDPGFGIRDRGTRPRDEAIRIPAKVRELYRFIQNVRPA